MSTQHTVTEARHSTKRIAQLWPTERLHFFALPTMYDLGFCFPSNPDISGIGVRVAVYAQNFLSFVPAIFALLDKRVTPTELDNLEKQSTGILITAFALLVSTIVQAFNEGLTNLHAIVILNLSWMNNTNLFIYFLLYVYHRLNLANDSASEAHPSNKPYVQLGAGPGTPPVGVPSEGVEQEGGRDQAAAEVTAGGGTVDVENGSSRRARTLSIWVNEFKEALRNLVFLFGSAHLTVMAAVGIWLWHQPLSFGDSLPCSQSASIAVFGRQVSFTSKGLKGWSIFVYSLMLTPGVNLIIPALVFSVPIFIHSFVTPDTPRRALGLRSTIFGLGVLATINAIFVIDTEVMLRKNSPLVQKGDAQWTFGQTLALLLLLVPLRDIAETLLERHPKRLGRKLLEAAGKGKLDIVKDAYDLGADPGVKGERFIYYE